MEIIRDIRILEFKPNGYEGKFNGLYGNIYKETKDSKYIGFRIAKKLAELNFSFSDSHHLYIYLNNDITENEIIETQKNDLSWSKEYFFGIQYSELNKLSDEEINFILEEIIYKVLRFTVRNNTVELNKIDKVENEIRKYGIETEILWKSKIYKELSIFIKYKINQNPSLKIEVKNNFDIILKKKFNLVHHEDIYYLVDKIKFDKEKSEIIIEPKKNIRTEFVKEKYNDLLRLQITSVLQKRG